MAQTAAELRRQLADVQEEESNLKKVEKGLYNDERRKNFGKSKLYDGTKLAIVLVIIYLVIVGTFGSMHIGPFQLFSMDDFVKFLHAFSPIFITLTGSIGIGGTAKNIAKSIVESKKVVAGTSESWGEDAAKGGV